MHTRTPITLLAALVVAAPVVLAATQENAETNASISNVEPVPAQILQASPAFPSGLPGDEYLDSSSAAATVTYQLKVFDRNGEDDMLTVTGDQQQVLSTFLVEVYRPDESGGQATQELAASSDGIDIDASSTTCTATEIGRTKAQGSTGAPEVGRAWLLDDLEDTTAGNGVLSCGLAVKYNDGSPTPAGIYTLQVTAADALLATSGDPVEILFAGARQLVTTTVRQGSLLGVTVGEGTGVVAFGPVKPGDVAQNQGGILYTAPDDVVVLNAGGAAQADFGVRFIQDDLLIEDPMAPSSSSIACDRIAVAPQTQPTPPDALLSTGPGQCERDITGLSLAGGDVLAFQFGLLEPGDEADNWALRDGFYRGDLQVILTGPTGVGDPVGVPGSVVNPVPSFNADLLQDVDSVGSLDNVA